MVSVRLGRESTVRVMDEFAEKAGLKAGGVGTLPTILFLNGALVRDYQAGLKYYISDSCSRLDLGELYECHLERVRDTRAQNKSWESHRADDVALALIGEYLSSQHVVAHENQDIVAAAASLALAFYNQFGAGKDGALHIPVFNPREPAQRQHSHIYLKL